MRLCAAVVLSIALVATAGSRAQEIVPKGMIGVQLKIDDGKIIVQGTVPDGPAEKAGIKADDVVLKVNDYKVKDKDAVDEDLQGLVKEVVKNEPGTKLKVTVRRGDKEMTIEVTVGKPVAPKKED